jgi:hypothetical protein
VICPVCKTPDCRELIRVEQRDYWRCDICQASFLDPNQLPGTDAERAHYDLHENHPDDPGYRRFLAKLADPLLARLGTTCQGLDYGCGPGPALAAMLREAGHQMALYDPFFHDRPGALDQQYDFVTCTEVAEHFHHPAAEFERLNGLLKTGGWLAVMTCFQTDDARFADWHYRRDPTHVVFYREHSFRHIANHFGWTCEIPVKDVVLMQKRL